MSKPIKLEGFDETIKQSTPSTKNTSLSSLPSTLSQHNLQQKTSLKQYAQLVLKKVQEKVTTDYNEVAEELVNEYGNHTSSDQCCPRLVLR